MTWLKNIIAQAVTWALERVFEFFRWVKSFWGMVWAAFVTYIVVPIGWVLDFIIQVQLGIIDACGQMAQKIGELCFDDIPGYFVVVGDATRILNVYMPLDLAFGLIVALIVLWGICILVRLIIRFLPSVAGFQVGGN